MLPSGGCRCGLAPAGGLCSSLLDSHGVRVTGRGDVTVVLELDAQLAVDDHKQLVGVLMLGQTNSPWTLTSLTSSSLTVATILGCQWSWKRSNCWSRLTVAFIGPPAVLVPGHAWSGWLRGRRRGQYGSSRPAGLRRSTRRPGRWPRGRAAARSRRRVGVRGWRLGMWSCGMAASCRDQSGSIWRTESSGRPRSRILASRPWRAGWSVTGPAMVVTPWSSLLTCKPSNQADQP